MVRPWNAVSRNAMAGRLHSKSESRQVEGVYTQPATWLLVALTGVVLYLCWLIIAPFVSALTWAIALAVVLNPLRRRLIQTVAKTITAVVMLSIVIAVIALGLYLISQRLLLELAKGQEFVRGFIQPGLWQRLQESPAWFGSMLRWIESEIDINGIVQDLSAAVARSLAPAFGKSAVSASRLILSLFFFFFFIRDQEAFLAALRRILPLESGEIDHLFDRTASTVQATVLGRIVIGSIQGAIGGVLFALIGLPAPMFWAIVMGILSMLPVVGAFLVWIPAAIFLLVSGHWLRAIALTAGGIALIHPIDNILYPLFIGPRIGLHPTVLLIGFLGGLVAFGPPGIVLGPLVVTVAIALVEIWRARFVNQGNPIA